MTYEELINYCHRHADDIHVRIQGANGMITVPFSKAPARDVLRLLLIWYGCGVVPARVLKPGKPPLSGL